MKRQSTRHQMDGLIALLLFGVFAACVLVVLLTGADAYRRLTERDRTAYDRRTCIQYVATRVRQADCAGGIDVVDFDGTRALALDGGDGEYYTRVYYYDGYLMELYTSYGSEMEPRDGERVMAAGGLDFSREGSLLTVTATDARGEESTLLLSLRSGGAEDPAGAGLEISLPESGIPMGEEAAQ